MSSLDKKQLMSLTLFDMKTNLPPLLLQLYCGLGFSSIDTDTEDREIETRDTVDTK